MYAQFQDSNRLFTVLLLNKNYISPPLPNTSEETPFKLSLSILHITTIILNGMLRSQLLNLLAVEIESFPLSDGERIQLTSLRVLLVIFMCVVFLLVP